MKLVFSFGEGKTEWEQGAGTTSARDVLGGKGAGLASMTALGLPVPSGFTITTDACRAYREQRALPAALIPEVKRALARVEEQLGLRFGDPSAPLLLSVRSGSRASMPGMMDTVLNLGLNEQTVESLAQRTGNRRFALDAYRRFLAMYSDVVLGIGRHEFEQALDEARARVGTKKGIDITRLNGEELRRKVTDADIPEEALQRVVEAFHAIVKKKTNADFPRDPYDQLWGAIRAVFDSWGNHRAIVYRVMHDIPDDWGTACNVQAMVFGNLGDTSATGVAFTRNPSTGERVLYGEWLPNAQGEDVVAGIRTPMPLRAGGKNDDESLERRMPEAFATLVSIGEKLEKHFRDIQDLEFTIQDKKLYMLQCRAAKRTAPAAVHAAVSMVNEGLITKEEALVRVDASSLDQLLHPVLDPNAPKQLVARGLAASPGAARGTIVFSADEAERLAAAGQSVILVRVETSPEDIHGMKAASGILTSRGGMTSHAAVVARGMGKPCVAGCTALNVSYADQTVTITQYDKDGRSTERLTLKKGDTITLDGAGGHVYLGAVPVISAALTGELGELLSWADSVRRLRVRANADTPLDARTARGFGAEGIGLCRTEHMFFDEKRIRAVREMILADDVDARKHALAKLLPEQRSDFVEIFRAMAGLPVTIRLLDPPLHEFLPQEKKQIEELAGLLSVSVANLQQRIKELHEFNPMLGHRGCRLAITYPEIYAMQVRAILEAAADVTAEGVQVLPEIMIPLAMTREELVQMRAIVDRVAGEVFATRAPVAFAFGTMIELPRAALRANDLASVSSFFSFGTNDLTQCTMGLSRDDAGTFLPTYVERAILPKDPFVSIDVEGVGALVKLAVSLGRTEKPNLKIGICGEHGGDPASIQFFHDQSLDYVSCSPFRVIIARLAAAQAEVRSRQLSAKN
jgi:pyruvate,orthophosphate dikinase